MSPVSAGLGQFIFYAVFVVWLALTFFLEPIIIRKGREKASTREDRGSALLIYFSVSVSVVAAFGFADAGITPLPDWFFVVGVLLMLLGMFVREWAVITLRGFYSFRVRVLADHKVVDSGPYRLVRHPAYSGSILTMMGVGFAVQSAAAVLLLLVFCGIGYGYRIRVEEAALLKELGEEYSKYMGRTKRLIPFIL